MEHPDTGTQPKNLYGATPLHFAALSGIKQTIDFLIHSGAEVNEQVPILFSLFGQLAHFKKDNAGNTALHNCAMNGFSDCCELLIKRGAFITQNHETVVSHFSPINLCLLTEVFR